MVNRLNTTIVLLERKSKITIQKKPNSSLGQSISLIYYSSVLANNILCRVIYIGVGISLTMITELLIRLHLAVFARLGWWRIGRLWNYMSAANLVFENITNKLIMRMWEMKCSVKITNKTYCNNILVVDWNTMVEHNLSRCILK